MIYEQDDAWNGRNQKPGGVIAQPSEIETHFLPVIVCNEVQRLHLTYVVSCDETEEQTPFVTIPALTDLCLELIMHREVINDDSNLLIAITIDITSNLLFYVNFFLKDTEH